MSQYMYLSTDRKNIDNQKNIDNESLRNYFIIKIGQKETYLFQLRNCGNIC